MTLRAWDPLGDLLKLQEGLNRLIQASLSPNALEGTSPDGTWVPAADAYETAEAFVVLVDLPGVEEGDLTVEMQDDTLVVKGYRRCEGPARAEAFHRLERTSGAFARALRLPEHVDLDHARAQLRDGLLRLELPKVRGRRPSRPERGP